MSDDRKLFEERAEKIKAALHDAVWKGGTASGSAAQIISELSLEVLGKGIEVREHAKDGVHALVLELVQGAHGTGAALMQFSEGEHALVPFLLDTVIALVEKSVMDATLLGQVVQELVDTCAISDLEQVFDYVISKIGVLLSPKFRKNRQPYLRACNSAMRRLTRSFYCTVRVKVLIFMAKLMPVDERSGLNLMNLYAENDTAMEEPVAGQLDSMGQPIDWPLYKTFWGLQKAFNAPRTLAASDTFATAMADILKVLDALKDIPINVPASAFEGGTSSVKYLSSSKLMALQLRDSTFRRQFLTQCMILSHFCRHPHKTKKTVGKDVKLEDEFKLKPVQLEKLSAVDAAVAAAFSDTPEDGPVVHALVADMLANETRWVHWKQGAPVPPNTKPNPAAPSYVKPPVPTLLGQEDIIVRPAKIPKATPQEHKESLGSEALDRLWSQTDDNMSCLKTEERGAVRDLRAFLQPVIDDMNEGDVEEEDKMKNDKLYSWKAFRLLSRGANNVKLFSQIAGRTPRDVKKPVPGEIWNLDDAIKSLYPKEITKSIPPVKAEEPAKEPAKGVKRKVEDAS